MASRSFDLRWMFAFMPKNGNKTLPHCCCTRLNGLSITILWMNNWNNKSLFTYAIKCQLNNVKCIIPLNVEHGKSQWQQRKRQKYTHTHITSDFINKQMNVNENTHPNRFVQFNREKKIFSLSVLHTLAKHSIVNQFELQKCRKKPFVFQIR